MPSMLLSCVAYADAGILQTLADGGPEPSLGAVLTAVTDPSFAARDVTDVHLIWNDAVTPMGSSLYPAGVHLQKVADRIRREIHARTSIPLSRIRLHQVELENVADHIEVYPAMVRVLTAIDAVTPFAGRAVYAAISSGTPAMQTSWILMAEAGVFPLRLLRSVERRHAKGGPLVVDVPLQSGILPKLERLEAYQRAFATSATNDVFLVNDPTALSEKQQRLVAADEHILIIGETGTGKEELATSIHASLCAARGATIPFVPFNCGAVPQALFESELFGHKKGAFTGADTDRTGLLHEADAGVLFLDEINSMALDHQVKLLRFLDSRTGDYRRVGDSQVRHSRTRIVAASNAPLRALVAQGLFREDLYNRLCAIEFRIAPLRDRQDRIVPIAMLLLQQFGSPLRLAPEAERLLRRHPWTGNVRELRNVIRRLTLLHNDGIVTRAHLREVLSSFDETQAAPVVIPEDLHGKAMDLVKQILAEAAMRQANDNTVQAARILGVSHPTVKKLAKG